MHESACFVLVYVINIATVIYGSDILGGGSDLLTSLGME
jgi:hypothetical protein